MIRCIVKAAAVFAVMLSAVPAFAAGAATPNTVLFLGTTVPDGMSDYPVTVVQSMGYDVEIATNAQWAAKSTADFATYRAIVLADPECVTGRGPIAAAEANANVWGAAVDGPVMAVGTDAHFHHGEDQGGSQLIRSGLEYVLSSPRTGGLTGAYISLSCYYNESGKNNAVPVLRHFGTFTVSSNTTPCHEDVHITAPEHPAMRGLTDANLSNWDCSIHALFTKYASNFQPLAIADNLGRVYTDDDRSVGTPYILARAATGTPAGGGGGGTPNCPAPTVTIKSISPKQIWPPNNKMVNVVSNVATTGTGVTVTRMITSSDGATRDAFYRDGSDVYHFQLLATRSGGNKSGRTYTITYTATDACGATATASTTVVVPHDQGKGKGDDDGDSDGKGKKDKKAKKDKKDKKDKGGDDKDSDSDSH